VLRPATEDDRDQVLAMARAEDIAWFGEPQFTPEEMGEFLDHVGGMAAGVVAVDDSGQVHGYAGVGAVQESLLVVDPADANPPYAELIDWIRDRGAASLNAYSNDLPRLDALEQGGWRHAFSNFELARPGAELVEKPTWPDGVTLAVFDLATDAERAHHLIYVDARWADVPGHHERPLESWRQMLRSQEKGWLALRGDRTVGVVIGRVFADGRAWIHQLAVAQDERGNGIGRALLLHAYTELLAAGATSLGLDVQAHNDNALGLYRSVGLEITREWGIYQPA
jgi:ribosomal protein S18 acetylase RimI-like enzyme